MKKYIFCFIALLMSGFLKSAAQESYSDKVKKYIQQYSLLAMAEQRSDGVPACVTLAQGVLETQAGGSDLMLQANNHFGVKCANDWQGETYLHDDETKNECFKKYNSAAESYKDHTDHLKRNPRYASLFTISVTDYAGWASGLKKCGYATSPTYATQLIKIIEDYKLQEYTYAAMDSLMWTHNPDLQNAARTTTANGLPKPQQVANAQSVAAPKEEQPLANADQPADMESVEVPDTTVSWDINSAIDSSKIVEINGMKAVYVNKGEMLLPYAVKYHLRYPRLLEMNDLPDGPAPFTMYIYLEKKLTYGVNENHTVADGETLLMVSQAEGLQLKKLMTLNQLSPNEEPVTGTVLELQKPAFKKPEVRIVETIAHKENAIITPGATEPKPEGDYVTINRPKSKSQPNAQKTTQAGKPGNTSGPAPAAKGKAATIVIPDEEAEDTVDDGSLASLKADLDKEVYADDSKLPSGKQGKQPAKAKTDESVADGGVKYYTIKKGENASVIARKNNITLKQLLAWNKIEPDEIRAGDKLLVTDPGNKKLAEKELQAKPGKAATPQKSGDQFYVIKKGETLSAIAAKNHITVKQLMKWNDVEADKIRDGQKLRVTAPGTKAEDDEEDAPAAPKKAVASAPKSGGKYYTIQKGETLSAIAVKNHITVKQLLKWNDIDADKIRDGQKLRVKE